MTPERATDRQAAAAPRGGWLERLGLSAFEADDDPDLRLRKTLLLLAVGLTNAATALWLGLYWLLGMRLPSNLPLAYQLASAILLFHFLRARRFAFYRTAQLALFLFFPFVIQWSIGSFVSASGIVLLALLAPVGAMVIHGTREALPWFAAYVVMMFVSGAIDYFLMDGSLQGMSMRTAALFFSLNFTMLSTIVFLLLRHLLQRRDALLAELAEQHRLLGREQRRADELVSSLLPPYIAERLKRDQGNLADGYADVTVMFADIVDFTRMSGQMEPRQVVDFLNHVFTRLDHLCARHGLEKIKTVGDAYMVVGGLGFGGAHYVEAMADMALEVQAMSLQDPVLRQRDIRFHVGIATGPAVAGVIGATRLSYDVWGDTVNLAARLAEDSAPGTSLVDRATYVRLASRYVFSEPREEVFKGTGRTLVFKLTGRRGPELQPPPRTARQSDSTASRSAASSSAGRRA